MASQPSSPHTAAALHQQLNRVTDALQSTAESTSSAVKALTTRWLAQWSDDLETRESLVAFGFHRLLDVLITTACEGPSAEQQQAEHVLWNLLTGHHTATAVLQRPSAVPLLLQHLASGKASDQLAARLAAAAAGGADFEEPVHLEDGRATIELLKPGHGEQVQTLAAAFIQAWVSASRVNRKHLAALGLNPVLADAGMAAVSYAHGDHTSSSVRALQQQLCRLVLLMAGDTKVTSDGEMARWVQPLLFTSADSAAAGDLELADLAMQTLACCAGVGGPLVKEAFRGL